MPELVSDSLTKVLVDMGVLPPNTLCYDIVRKQGKSLQIVATINVLDDTWKAAVAKAGSEILNKEMQSIQTQVNLYHR